MSTRARTLLIVCLLVVASGAVSSPLATATASDGPGPTSGATAPAGTAPAAAALGATGTVAAANGSGSIGSKGASAVRGDDLTIEVSHSSSGKMYFKGGGYELRVNLTGSGSTEVTIDTYNVTGPASGYVSGGGDATVLSGYPSWPLAPMEYVVNVTVGGVERDLGTVTIEPRREMRAETMIAPSSSETSSPSAAVDAATPGDVVAEGDKAVVRVEESGLANALNETDLSGGAAAEGIEVAFRERGKRTNAERHRFVAGPGNDDVSIVPDLENDEFYVVWDTGNLSLGANEEARTYDVSVSLVGEHNNFVDENRTLATTDVTVERPWFSLSADPGYTLHPWNDTTLTVDGRTNMAKGTELEVRTRSLDPVFLMTETATVDANGSFTATFDYGPHGRGYEAPLWLLGQRESTEATVRVVSANASLTLRDQVASRVVVLDEVTLGGGGFVSLTDGGERILGTTEYLSPGTHESVAIELNRSLNESTTVRAVAYMDRNRNRTYDAIWDPAYGSGNETVASTALVTVPGTATSTPSATTTGATPANATSTPGNVTTTNATAANATTVVPTAGLDFVVPTDIAVAAESPVTPSTGAGAPLSPGLAVVSVVLAGILIRRL